MAAITKKYIVASRRIASKMVGMPGNLLVLGPLAVKKMIKNVKRSAMPQRRGVRDAKEIRASKVNSRWKSDGRGVPKATETLLKASTADRQSRGMQTLYTSKFISDGGCTDER